MTDNGIEDSGAGEANAKVPGEAKDVRPTYFFL